MKIVYITGCLGFIGGYVTRRALQAGWHVRGIDKITYAANLELLDEFSAYSNFIFEPIDINEIEFLYDCDYFINTAAETHVGNSIVDSHSFLHSNVNGVHHILELLRNYRQENSHQPVLIQFSTDEVYPVPHICFLHSQPQVSYSVGVQPQLVQPVIIVEPVIGVLHPQISQP
jgi:dTDP-glucose 4,6-dehydratase